MSEKRLLIVDDNPGFYDTFRDRNEEQWEVVCQDNYIRGVSDAKSKKWQAVIVDLGLPPLNYDGGIKKVLMPIVAAAEKRFPVLVLSADNRPDTPMRVRELGADVFLQKGKTDDQILLTTLEDSIRRFGRKSFEDQFVARSAVMEQIKQRLRTLVNYTDQPVLITGETGTGKDMAARYLHACKDDGKLKFVPVNIAGLTPTLQSSELFGHVKGAFTGAMGNKSGLFAEAQNGTLFLDEIGEINEATQVNLLRVIQERSFRPVGGTAEHPLKAHLVFATNRIPEKALQEGLFRADFYERISSLRVHIPPLRERPEEVIPLLAHFWEGVCHPAHPLYENSLQEAFTSDALHLLESYEWPTNIRQLKNSLQKLIFEVEVRGLEQITASLVRQVVLQNGPALRVSVAPAAGTTEPVSISAGHHLPSHEWTIEKRRAYEDLQRYEKALVRHLGKKEAAASALGLGNDQNLRYRIKVKYFAKYPELFADFPSICEAYKLEVDA